MEARGGDGDAALGLVRVTRCNDAWELLRALDAAADAAGAGGLVVVDAPSAVLQQNMGGDRNPAGHQLVALVGAALWAAARRGLAVVVANSTARAYPDDDELGGGARGGRAVLALSCASSGRLRRFDDAKRRSSSRRAPSTATPPWRRRGAAVTLP